MKKFVLSLAGILTLIVFVLLIVGFSHPSFNYGNSVQITASPDKCFNFLTDTMKIAKWMKGFESQRVITGTPMTPGATYQFVINDGERMVMEQKILSVNNGRNIEYALTNDVLRSQYSYSLAGDSTETRVETQYVVEGNNVFMKAILFFSKSYLQRADLELLEDLKKTIESN
jgi:uncharacterized protein YndB with AHSA1/START domain